MVYKKVRIIFENLKETVCRSKELINTTFSVSPGKKECNMHMFTADVQLHPLVL